MTETVTEFKGIRNDVGSKHVSSDYFFDALNVNYDDIVGANKILMPERVIQCNTSSLDGTVDYKYLDSNNILQSVKIAVQGGNIYKNWDSVPVLIYSGLQVGLCDFTVMNDKLFIVNGKDYPLVYWGAKNILHDMGSPAIETDYTLVALSGTYKYQMTYITPNTPTDNEEIIGTTSNSFNCSSSSMLVNLPIGNTIVTKRKLYRTKADGSIFYYIATIDNNSDLTYVDSTLDSSLTVEIGAINNEMVKPYFIDSQYGKIVASVVDKFPTQAFVSEAGIEVLDSATFVDISNEGGDNSPLVGQAQDYSQIILGSRKNIYLMDISGTTNTVKRTRSNVGVKSGYTMKYVPAQGNFDAGVMFVSSLNDIRVISGSRDLIPNTLNDITTDNWAQVVRGTIGDDISASDKLYAEFFDYKYHLITTNARYVFDIRINAWSKHIIQSESYISDQVILSVIDGVLYNGQSDGYIEREYASVLYRGEDVKCWIESPHLYVSNMWYFLQSMSFWFLSSDHTEIKVTVITNDDYKNSISSTFVVNGQDYDSQYFNNFFFNAGSTGEDYRTFNITRRVRWCKFIIECSIGRMLFRGFKIEMDKELNKEA